MRFLKSGTTVWCLFLGLVQKPLPLYGQSSPIAQLFEIGFRSKSFTETDTPALSPDGKWVAYVVRTPKEKESLNGRYLENGTPVQSVGSSITITFIDSGMSKQICSPSANCWRPAWAPDSQKLAFYSDEGGAPQLWIYTVSAEKAERVVEAKIKASLWAKDEPRWSRDGHKIYVGLQPQGEDSAEPKPSQLTKEKKDYIQIFRSGKEEVFKTEPSSEPLNNFYRKENQAVLARINLPTGKVARLLPPNIDPFPSVFRLSPSEKWLSYLSVFKKKDFRSETLIDLAVAEESSGKVSFVARDLPLHHGAGLFEARYCWHPAEDRLVFIKNDELWLVDFRGANPAQKRLAPHLKQMTATPFYFDRSGQHLLVGIRAQGSPPSSFPDRFARVSLNSESVDLISITHPWIPNHVLLENETTFWEPEANKILVAVTNGETGEEGIMSLNLESKNANLAHHGHFHLGKFTYADRQRFRIAGIYEDIKTPTNLFLFEKLFFPIPPTLND